MWRASIKKPIAISKHDLARCSVESHSEEFSSLVGESPEFKFLAEGAAEGEDGLAAHEAGIFVAEWSCGGGASVVFTTTPFYDGERDALVNEIKRLNLESGEVSSIWRSSSLVNGGTIGPDGRLYFVFQGQSLHACRKDKPRSGVFSFHPPECPGEVTDELWSAHVERWGAHNFNSPNDIVVRRKDGSIWFTDPSYGFRQGFRSEPELGEWVWRLDPKSGKIAVVADGFKRPNGICFSPDESVVYITDTGYVTGNGGRFEHDVAAPRSVYAFDVAEDGAHLVNRRLLYVADDGVPDGIEIDHKGRIYTGCGDGVHVLSPTGSLLGKVLIKDAGGGVVNLCLGHGKHADTLYILAESAVISLRLHDARGVA